MTRLTEAFLTSFRRDSERRWASLEMDREVYGFQFQKGTRWLPGLSEGEIEAFEARLKATFSPDVRLFLRHMNGTDLPTKNIYGDSGEPPALWPGIYSYPRDLTWVKSQVKEVRGHFKAIQAELEDQGFTLHPQAFLLPIYGHRFVVCTPASTSSPVLSLHGTDAIVYAKDLRAFLEMEFLGRE